MICLLCENTTAIIKSETSTFKGITYEHEYISCSSCGEDYEPHPEQIKLEIAI